MPNPQDPVTPDHKAASEPLLRQLGPIGIWLLAINGMIGAGIFGAPAGAAALTGIYSPLVFLACGALLTAVILCFAELASYFRNTGGPIVYVRAAFGEMAGFQTGWAFYIARVTAFAANINLLVASISWFWQPVAEGAGRVFMLGLVVLLLAVPNVLGTRHGMRSLGILTVLKFLPLLALVAFGISALTPAAFPIASTPVPDAISIGTAALLVIYAFVGWEAAVVPAGETRNPARDMPKALISAVLMVTVLYVLIQAIAVAKLPNLADSERALVDLGQVLFGPVGAMLLTAAVVVSVGGNIASTMITAPRLTYSLARENTLPIWLGRVHPRFHTPAASIVAFSLLVFALSVYGSFIWLAAMSALVRVLIYMTCIAAMPRLRRHHGKQPGRFRIPGGWSVPAMAFVVSALLLFQVQWQSVLVTLAFLMMGAVLFLCSKRQ